MRILSIRIRNWCMYWAFASETYACTEHTHQVLTHALYKGSFKHAEHTHKELMPACTEHTHKELMRMLRETLLCKNHENPSDLKSHTWAPLIWENEVQKPHFFLSSEQASHTTTVVAKAFTCLTFAAIITVLSYSSKVEWSQIQGLHKYSVFLYFLLIFYIQYIVHAYQ